MTGVDQHSCVGIQLARTKNLSDIKIFLYQGQLSL